jgi:glycerol-3-phosphate acyltransferase PlsY
MSVRRGGAAIAAATGYVIGSIPFGLLLGRAARGLDVRDLGSGSMGTTNVLRAVGPGAAAATFALDVAKGAAAIRCARALDAGPAGEVTAGIAAMVGHSWPVFAGFRGGKSVATAFGVLLEISPEASRWALAGGVAALATTRTMSVASLAAAGSATVGAGVAVARGGEVAPLVFTGLASALIVVRHTANVRRLLRGLEPPISLSKPGG